MKNEEFLNQKVKDMSVSELAEAIKLKEKEGYVEQTLNFTASNVTITASVPEPKEQWKDITKECEFRLGDDNEGTHYLNVMYQGKHIANAISVVNNKVLGICPTKQKEYKIVTFDGKESGYGGMEEPTNFKILKKEVK